VAQACFQLKELRLNDNKLDDAALAALPARLHGAARLTLLDIGNNPVTSLACVGRCMHASACWPARARARPLPVGLPRRRGIVGACRTLKALKGLNHLVNLNVKGTPLAADPAAMAAAAALFPGLKIFNGAEAACVAFFMSSVQGGP
jgi:hypothetical protein